MTLEPDGTATGCNPVEVGSTPTGVSDCPTAGSDYINQNLMSEPFLRWMVLHYCPTACRDYIQVANLAAEKARLDEPSLGSFLRSSITEPPCPTACWEYMTVLR